MAGPTLQQTPRQSKIGRAFLDFMPNPKHPCIVVPGIKGTGLENIYELPSTTTWSTWEAGVVVPHFDSLALESNGEVDEAQIVVNRPSQLLAIAYQSFV